MKSIIFFIIGFFFALFVVGYLDMSVPDLGLLSAIVGGWIFLLTGGGSVR